MPETNSLNALGEYGQRETEEVALGVSDSVDACLARITSVSGAKSVIGFRLKNRGRGKSTVTMKKRGKRADISAEDLTDFQVGSTKQVKGKLAKRRIVPGTLVITDTTASTPQTVKDTDGDGKLYQTSGPNTATYPKLVGTVDYTEGTFDFTFLLTITDDIQIDYGHTDWSAFTSSITKTIVAGGSFEYNIIGGENANAANWYNGLKGEVEVGLFGKRASGETKPTILSLVVMYHGGAEDLELPLVKGEIKDYPYHNS